MKRLAQSELDATYRIFSHVNQLVGGYYGHKTRQKIEKFASRNRWIMFPVYNADSLREGTGLPVPNIYVSFDDEIQDDGSGRADSWIGVSYGNSNAMLWLRDILRRKKRASSFIGLVNSMGSDWEVNTIHKIHTNYWGSTPIYKKVNGVLADVATITGIQQGISDGDKCRMKPGTLLDGDQVTSCVTTLSIEGEATPESFDQDIKNLFAFFTAILSLK